MTLQMNETSLANAKIKDLISMEYKLDRKGK